MPKINQIDNISFTPLLTPNQKTYPMNHGTGGVESCYVTIPQFPDNMATKMKFGSELVEAPLPFKAHSCQASKPFLSNQII